MIDLHQAPPTSPPTSRGRRMVGPALSAAGIAAIGAFMHVWDPNQPSIAPSCPFLTLTGFYCPGCGSTRTIHALAHGDLVTAMERNPLAVLAFGILFVGLVRWTRRLWRGEPLRSLAPPWVLWTMLVVIVVYWVSRNVPGWTWLSPL